jgi:hypothetical protein
VARLVTEPLSDVEKDLIVKDLEAESSWHHNISTQLAQDMGQYTPKWWQYLKNIKDMPKSLAKKRHDDF